MKLLIACATAMALFAAPVAAQETNNTMAADQKGATETTHVTRTTKHVKETNVPVRHHARRHHARHHAVRCGCPSKHMKAHHAKTHHVKKTTTTTTTTPKTKG